MKNIFKKIAVVALVMIMCVSSIVPSISATETKCPGEGYTHTADNCSYTVVAKADATCEAAGTVTGKCNLCETKFVAETIAALGHDYKAAAAAKCTDDVKMTCTLCGDVKPVEGTNCTWSKWTVTGGVCKIGERRTRTCEVCGTTETNVMTEAHNWVVDSYVEPTLCNEPAIAYYVCENGDCDAKKTADLWLKDGAANHGTFVAWDAAAHDGKADPNAVAPTCASVGYKSEVCSVCDYVRVVTLPKKDHEISDLRFVDEVLQGGCGTVGTKAYWQCFDCGARYQAVATSTTKYYAADGTTYPVFTADQIPEGKGYGISNINDEYYPLYEKSEYDKTTYGALIESNSVLKSDVRYGLTHERYTTYVAATCEADGYYSQHCSWCGQVDKSGILPATGHVYYSDNPSAEVQKAVLKKLLPDYDSSKTYNFANYAPGKDAGKNITWIDGADATCDKNAYVYEICLNVHTTYAHYSATGTGVSTATAACSKTVTPSVANENVKEYLLSGEGKEATGHEWAKSEGAEWKGSPAPTCTATGVYVITCANTGCGATKNETAVATGHDFTGTKTVVEAATCVKDGSATVACKNGCGESQTVVLPKSDEYHVFNYISAGATYGHDNVVAAIAALKCGQSLDVVFSCSTDNCPAKVNPATYTVVNDSHKYYDTTDADNLKAIKDKKNVGDKIYDTTNTSLVAVECVVAGDCTKVAAYRLNCLEGCGMFKSFEVTEGFNTGAHSVVYSSPAAHVANKCTEKDGTALKEYVIGYWYCSVKTCPLYSETVGDKTKGTFTVYSSHLTADGKAVSYKDVPDAAISGAATLAEAQTVKAPVDENGNTIYSVAIPGTSLVWMYVADVTCANDGVTLGGFYCVNCGSNQSKLTNEAKAVIYKTNDAHHTLVTKPAVASTCTTYGYTEKTCVNCFYTVQTNFNAIDDHSFVVVETKASTCERDGYVISRCTGCKVYNTVVDKADGHRIMSGDTVVAYLTGNCLDDLSVNRTCSVCTKKVFLDHVYVDSKCTLCGAAE